MPTMKVRDIDIYYETKGAGPRLLCITGTNGDLRRKPSVLDSLLAERFQLLAYDQRGLGRTSKPDRPYSMAEYADDAAGLMDALGWTSARVSGISFGGMVAQEFALRHPKKVERLALACTAPGGAGGASFPLHTLGHMSAEDRARLLLGVQDTRRGEAWQKQDPERAKAAVAEMMARRAPVDPGDPLIAMGMRRQLEARAAHDVYARLPALTVPVGIFAGKYDAVAPEAAQHALARQIKGATLRFFDGGHLFLMQDPAAYPAVAEFLAA
ncbi:MAG TPA: alpha/beta fold hydrolase [Candidatus Cybelea sp.]|nr:alpha/beta fold hydrolase [Candidatus Cybelea sp.]